MKSLSKNTIFIQKMLVADVVTAKYIEEAQPLKLQLHKWTKKINFNPQKATTCISEKSILAAQAFSFRGNKYVTKKVRVVSLAHEKPIGPNLCFYQILSNISNH